MIHRLSNFLTKECKKRNLSVKQLSHKSSLSEDYIRKIKRNIPQSLTIDSLESLAKGLDMTLRELLEEIGYIDILKDYILSIEQSYDFVQKINDYLHMVNIDITTLNQSEILEISNLIMLYIKTLSYKFK